MGNYKLLIKKLALAFGLGALPVFAYGMLGVLDAIAAGNSDYDFQRVILTSVLVGAASAGIRGVIAEFTNWMPTDKLHGIGDNPDSVVVTKAS